MKTLLLSMLVTLWCIPTNAQEGLYYTKENYLIAYTKETLQKAAQYVADKDEAAFQSLVSSGKAVVSKKNVEVYIVEWGMSYVKIRPKGKTSEFWMPTSGVSKTPN